MRLADLFTGDRPLIVYHFMYGKAQTDPCPMCTMWIDGYNGVAQHLDQNVDFAVIAAADPAALQKWAETRGWTTDLRLLSAGNQDSTVSVFTRATDGVRNWSTGRASGLR